MIEKDEIRDKVFDVAKGISILLMTVTHLTLFNNYPTLKLFNMEAFYLFKMPLFIIVSGCLFSEKNTFREFCFGKFDGLLKPVVSICLITGLVFGGYYLMDGRSLDFIKSNVLSDLIDIFYPLWFPVNLFIAIVLFRWLLPRTATGGRQSEFFRFFILFSGLALLNQLYDDYLYVKLNSLIYFMIFLSIGFFIKKRGLKDMLLNKYSFVFFLTMFAFCVFFREPLNVKLGLYSNTFGNFFTTMAAAFSGSVVILNLSKWISGIRVVSPALILCSRASFFILALHIVVEKMIVTPLANLIAVHGPAIDIMRFLLVIFICITFYKALFRTRYAKYFFLPLKSFGAALYSLSPHKNM